MRSCPSCGYEFRDIDAVESVKELSLKIERSDSDEARAALVRSFPIPNTREDIIEFLILAVSNIDERSPYGSEEEESLTKAWIAKADQALRKAELVIPDDEVFTKSKALYKRKTEAFEKAIKRRGKRKTARKELSDKEAENQQIAIILIPIVILIAIMFVVVLLGS